MAQTQQLTEIRGVNGPDSFVGYIVQCRDCGDVTRHESGYTTEGPVPIEQAHIYRLRHLADHLRVLSLEITSATR